MSHNFIVVHYGPGDDSVIRVRGPFPIREDAIEAGLPTVKKLATERKTMIVDRMAELPDKWVGTRLEPKIDEALGNYQKGLDQVPELVAQFEEHGFWMDGNNSVQVYRIHPDMWLTI